MLSTKDSYRSGEAEGVESVALGRASGVLPEPSGRGWVGRGLGETNLNIDSCCKESPELTPGHPDALRVRRLGSREFKLPGAQVIEGKPRGGPPVYGFPVHVCLWQPLVELGRDERCDGGERPVQREAPADAAGSEVVVALEDEERDVKLFQVLGEDEAAYAGADDEDRGRGRRGRRHGRRQ